MRLAHALNDAKTNLRRWRRIAASRERQPSRISPSSMTSDTGHETRRVTLVAPRGTLVVRAPRDVAIAELMPDFIVAGVTGDEVKASTDGWVLCSDDGDPYPPTATLTECGIASDDVLVLRRRNASPAPAERAGATKGR